MEVVEDETAECLPEYELEMAKGQLKTEVEEMVSSNPKQSMRETMRDVSEKLSELNPDLTLSENDATTVLQCASKFNSFIKKPGALGNIRRTHNRRGGSTFRLNSLEDTVKEVGEQIINPTHILKNIPTKHTWTIFCSYKNLRKTNIFL